MQTLPFAIVQLWKTLVAYPFALIGLVVFAVLLYRLANRLRCYGLPKNLLFGAVGGAVAFALFQAYVFAGQHYGFRSVFIAELLAAYETAVVLTVILRLVHSQRPPQPRPPVVEDDSN